jgi:hypothetical protein
MSDRSSYVHRDHEHHERHVPVLVCLGYWGWGIVLVLILVFIGCVLFRVSLCVDAAESTKDVIALDDCPPWVQNWYLVLRDWQTGIGAAIGLLGVAWSTFYKSATSGQGH